jgi:hypothetical protein
MKSADLEADHYLGGADMNPERAGHNGLGCSCLPLVAMFFSRLRLGTGPRFRAATSVGERLR